MKATHAVPIYHIIQCTTLVECKSVCFEVAAMWALAIIVTLSLRILFVFANVEKTIFLGPEAIHIPQTHPNLDDLRLDILNPTSWNIRRQVVATFLNSTNPKGSETWILLDGLEQNQRYEVRICWAATVSCTYQSHANSHLSFDGFLVVEVNALSFTLIIHRQLATNSIQSQHIYAARGFQQLRIDIFTCIVFGITSICC